MNLLSCALDLKFSSIFLPFVSPCLERHPSHHTEYWLYYETWGIFHNHSTFLQNHLLDFIEITKRETVYREDDLSGFTADCFSLQKLDHIL